MKIRHFNSTIDIMQVIKDICKENHVSQCDSCIDIYEHIVDNKIVYREISLYSRLYHKVIAKKVID